MNWKEIGLYFPNQPPVFLQELFNSANLPWSPLKGLRENINNFFKDLDQTGNLNGDRKFYLDPDGTLKEGSYYINSTQELKEDFVDSELKIFIGKGSIIEAGST